MSTLDIIILVCFIPGVIRGISTGFVKQATSLVSVVLGVWLASRFTQLVCALLEPHFPTMTEKTLTVISFAIILIGVILILHLLGRLVTGILRGIMLGWADKVLGMVFSLLVTTLLIGLAIMVFESINGTFSLVSQETLDASVLYNPIKGISNTIFPYLKELIGKA